jgi:DNA primase
MAFPPQFLEELRNRINLASLIGRKVRLVKRGREYSGLCPFHNEKSPSFTVNEDKGFYHCFGCGAHGDAVSFEMQASHLSFPEAVERLAAEAGLEPPRATPQEREKAKRQATLYDVIEAACAFFQQQLREPGGQTGAEYLRRRGLSEDTIARFRLGWSPDGREAMKRALAPQFGEPALIEAGLLIRPEGGGTPYDRFRGRVMFPITDRRGRVVAFGGRILGDGQPKYLNSPDTPLFHKGRLLYGLAQARNAAAAARTVVAVEGYMDVIALHQAGIQHSVAPLGTALTEQQIEELWKLADEPVLCFDGDAAGQRAAGRAALRALPLLRPGLSLRFATVPAAEDPDSLVKSGGVAAMQAVLERAEPLSEVLWRGLLAGRVLDTPERRAGLEKELKDNSDRIADETVRRQYERLFKDKLFQTFRPNLRGQTARLPYRGGPQKKDPRRDASGRLLGARPPPPPADGRVRQQFLMVDLVVRVPAMIDRIGEELGGCLFDHRAVAELRDLLMDCYGMPDDAREDAITRLTNDPAYREMSERFGPPLFGRLDDEARLARAMELWHDAYHRFQLPELLADKEHAEADLVERPNEQRFDRLVRLREAYHRLHYGDN